jgi:hypothetical protein
MLIVPVPTQNYREANVLGCKPLLAQARTRDGSVKRTGEHIQTNGVLLIDKVRDNIGGFDELHQRVACDALFLAEMDELWLPIAAHANGFAQVQDKAATVGSIADERRRTGPQVYRGIDAPGAGVSKTGLKHCFAGSQSIPDVSPPGRMKGEGIVRKGNEPGRVWKKHGTALKRWPMRSAS